MIIDGMHKVISTLATGSNYSANYQWLLAMG